jgi:translation elongation factor EF-1beta
VKLVITENEIVQAIKTHMAKRIVLQEGEEMDITFSLTRSPTSITANIDIGVPETLSEVISSVEEEEETPTGETLVPWSSEEQEPNEEPTGSIFPTGS